MILAEIGGIHMGDVIFQLVAFIIMAAVVAGVISFIVKRSKRYKQLDRVEGKVDKLLSEKK